MKIAARSWHRADGRRCRLKYALLSLYGAFITWRWRSVVSKYQARQFTAEVRDSMLMSPAEVLELSSKE